MKKQFAFLLLTLALSTPAFALTTSIATFNDTYSMMAFIRKYPYLKVTNVVAVNHRSRERISTYSSETTHETYFVVTFER